MIYFERSNVAAVINDLANQEANNGTWNRPLVVEQLGIDFHGKCYLCGCKTSDAPRIEHFRPRNPFTSLTYSWRNLFLSCDHCNSLKSDDYHNLIDCSEVFPDTLISFHVQPLARVGKKVAIKAIDTNTNLTDTIELLDKIYVGTSALKKLSAKLKVDRLIDELNDFSALVNHYLASNDPDELEDIKIELNNTSEFTAFKRQLVRDNSTWNQQFSSLFIN